MSESGQTVSGINEKIKEGRCVVLTEMEFLREARRVSSLSELYADIVTVAFEVEASGSAVMLCVPVAGRGVFTRAEKIWLNGVAGLPGPAPNERLGLVDTLIFADQPSNDQISYRGADLFLDIISRKNIHVECLSVEGDRYTGAFTMDKLQFARMYIYNCFLERLSPAMGLNRLNQAKHIRVITTGSKVLLNRASGVVIGCGTHSSSSRMALSITAEMFEMDPGTMKEYWTPAGMTITSSVAVAIPILTAEVLEDLLRSLSGGISRNQHAGAENEMAEDLKKLVLDGKFGLTDSDLEL